jgi:hypothetical protein
MRITAAEWDALPFDGQLELLAYEQLREAEETINVGCPMFGGTPKA